MCMGVYLCAVPLHLCTVARSAIGHASTCSCTHRISTAALLLLWLLLWSLACCRPSADLAAASLHVCSFSTPATHLLLTRRPCWNQDDTQMKPVACAAARLLLLCAQNRHGPASAAMKPCSCLLLLLWLRCLEQPWAQVHILLLQQDQLPQVLI